MTFVCAAVHLTTDSPASARTPLSVPASTLRFLPPGCSQIHNQWDDHEHASVLQENIASGEPFTRRLSTLHVARGHESLVALEIMLAIQRSVLQAKFHWHFSLSSVCFQFCFQSKAFQWSSSQFCSTLLKAVCSQHLRHPSIQRLQILLRCTD